MFYTLEMVQQMGFNNLDEFVADFVFRHPNSCVRFCPNGVSVHYDFDSEPAMACMEYVPVMIIGPTRDEIIDIMTANGMDINVAKTYASTFTDEQLKYKALMSNGNLWDVDVDGKSDCYQKANRKIEFGTMDFDDDKYKGYVFKADYMKNGD